MQMVVEGEEPQEGRRRGRVFLVGAGPGDPKLLTIRAAEVIASSDVIVFDYLVNPEVLVHARRGVELICAGKKAGSHAISQSEINRTLIEHARRGCVVARLKGGDPFVFGRGGEEAEALTEAGIEWEVVPGVSSGIAVPAYAGIPLTHRDYSSSVAFVTGHDSPSKTGHAVDWMSAAHSAETLVIFMCGQSIAAIAGHLIAAGRPASTPLAVIRWGTYTDQEVYSGTLEDAARLESDFDSPTIAVVGDVIRLREKLRWFGKQELEYSLSVLAEVEPVAV